MFGVTLSIDTRAAAARAVGGASSPQTDPQKAELVHSTIATALAAVTRVQSWVNACTGAQQTTARTLTLAADTLSTSCTLGATRAAVVVVLVFVHTCTVAARLTRRALRLTHPIGAGLRIRTAIVAGPTIKLVCLQIVAL